MFQDSRTFSPFAISCQNLDRSNDFASRRYGLDPLFVFFQDENDPRPATGAVAVRRFPIICILVYYAVEFCFALRRRRRRRHGSPWLRSASHDMHEYSRAARCAACPPLAPKSDSLDSTRPSALDTCCVRSHKRNLSRYDRQFVKVVYLNYQFRVPRYFLFVCVRTVIILCCLLCFVTLTHWRCTVYFQYGRLFTVSTYVLNFNLFIFKRLRAGVTVDQLINATEKRSRHELHYRIQHRRSYASLQADRFL